MTNVLSQAGIKYIYLETPVYEYLDYLINSGKSIPTFVVRQPYELDSDFDLKRQQPIGQYFDHYWNRFYQRDGINLHLNLRDHVKKDGAYFNRYRAEGGVHYTSAHITLANQTAIDQNYKYDRFFAGDLSESEHWLYGRVNEAYLNVNFDKFNFFIGRMKRNWGPIGQKSLILSDHPYSYDHLLFDYRTDHLQLSLIYAQLNNENAFTFDISDTTVAFVANARRYLVGHRLDIRFRDNFQVALTEMATYGGAGRDFEIAFMNPMNFYYPVQRNDQKQMDGFWALDLFYKPASKLTLYAQLLIDDIIVNNEPGVNDRGQYPDRFATMFSLRSADYLLTGLNTEMTYTRIWNRTYQSKYTYENYHYRGLGLGYPCASCEEIKIKLSYWGRFPLFVQNEIIFGRYGNVSLTDLFPLKKENFPIEPVQYNVVNHLKIYYFYRPSLRFFARAVYRSKTEHYSNRYGEQERWVFSVGLNLILSQAVKLD